MLDGRVKTLHPRVHGGLLADRRLDDHRRQLLGAGIAPFELVVVNLYPFAAALERPGITIDELIEEIDIGGPSMVRAAAKNHANVAIVTSPDAIRRRARGAGRRGRARRRLPARAGARGVRPHRGLRRADRGGAAGPVRGRGPARRRPEDPYPPTLTLALEKVETLRYGENPHQPAARYRRPGTTLDDGLFGVERAPLQGKALSYNNVLDAAAASGLGRALRGPGRRHRQAHEPVWRRRAGDAARGVGRRARSGPDQRLRRGRGADPRGRPSGGRGAHLDLPRDRRRSRLHGGGPRDPGEEAEPARARRRAPGIRRRRRGQRRVADRLDPDGRRRRPGDHARHRHRRTRRRGRVPRGAPRRTRSSSISTSPGAWSAA